MVIEYSRTQQTGKGQLWLVILSRQLLNGLSSGCYVARQRKSVSGFELSEISVARRFSRKIIWSLKHSRFLLRFPSARLSFSPLFFFFFFLHFLGVRIETGSLSRARMIRIGRTAEKSRDREAPL